MEKTKAETRRFFTYIQARMWFQSNRKDLQLSGCRTLVKDLKKLIAYLDVPKEKENTADLVLDVLDRIDHLKNADLMIHERMRIRAAKTIEADRNQIVKDGFSLVLDDISSYSNLLEQVVDELVIKTFEYCDRNKSLTAETLGINYKRVYDKIKKLRTKGLIR